MMTEHKMGPHFCTTTCYETHATLDDRAADLAELCHSDEHTEFDDSTPEITARHVAVHRQDIINAIDNLRTCARDLRDPADLNEVAMSLGATTRFEGRPTRDYARVTVIEGCGDLPSVSVASAAMRLAVELVPGFTDPGPSPFHGAGRSAQWRGEIAANALAVHFGTAEGRTDG